MKYVLATSLSLLFVSSAYAESLQLFVENLMPATSIVIEKADGMKIPIDPKTKIKDVIFEKNSQVKNYVNGRHVCTWIINSNGIPADWTLTGLEYEYENGRHICGRVATIVIDPDTTTDKRMNGRLFD